MKRFLLHVVLSGCLYSPVFAADVAGGSTSDLNSIEVPMVASVEPPTQESPTAQPQFRAAERGDLTGLWRQVTVKGSGDFDLSDTWYSGLQFWEFFDDEFLRVIVFETGVPSEADLKTIRLHGPKRSTWELLAPGLVEIRYVNGSRYTVAATWYLSAVKPELLSKNEPPSTQAEELPQAGDLTLAYLDKGTGKPLFFRLLRRVGDTLEPLPEVQNPKPAVPEAPRVEDDPLLQAHERRMQQTLDPYGPAQ
jgi:hypothetical protein